MHFYFCISVQLTVHMFWQRPGHHQGYTVNCTPDDGRVAAKTYVGLTEQKYENKSAFVGMQGSLLSTSNASDTKL
jgi:hypothetical protein